MSAIAQLPSILFPKADISQDVHRALVGAYNYISKHGWRSGSWGNPGGSRCLFGAIGVAIGLGDPSLIQDNALADECARVLGLGSVAHGMTWNDRRAGSMSAVLERLMRGIQATAPEPIKVEESPAPIERASSHEFVLS